MKLSEALAASAYNLAVLHGYPEKHMTMVHGTGIMATCRPQNQGDHTDFQQITELPAAHQELKQWYPVDIKCWRVGQILEFFKGLT